MVFITKLKASN